MPGFVKFGTAETRPLSCGYPVPLNGRPKSFLFPSRLSGRSANALGLSDNDAKSETPASHPPSGHITPSLSSATAIPIATPSRSHYRPRPQNVKTNLPTTTTTATTTSTMTAAPLENKKKKAQLRKAKDRKWKRTGKNKAVSSATLVDVRVGEKGDEVVSASSMTSGLSDGSEATALVVGVADVEADVMTASKMEVEKVDGATQVNLNTMHLRETVHNDAPESTNILPTAGNTSTRTPPTADTHPEAFPPVFNTNEHQHQPPPPPPPAVRRQHQLQTIFPADPAHSFTTANTTTTIPITTIPSRHPIHFPTFPHHPHGYENMAMDVTAAAAAIAAQQAQRAQQQPQQHGEVALTHEDMYGPLGFPAMMGQMAQQPQQQQHQQPPAISTHVTHSQPQGGHAQQQQHHHTQPFGLQGPYPPTTSPIHSVGVPPPPTCQTHQPQPPLLQTPGIDNIPSPTTNISVAHMPAFPQTQQSHHQTHPPPPPHHHMTHVQRVQSPLTDQHVHFNPHIHATNGVLINGGPTNAATPGAPPPPAHPLRPLQAPALAPHGYPQWPAHPTGPNTFQHPLQHAVAAMQQQQQQQHQQQKHPQQQEEVGQQQERSQATIKSGAPATDVDTYPSTADATPSPPSSLSPSSLPSPQPHDLPYLLSFYPTNSNITSATTSSASTACVTSSAAAPHRQPELAPLHSSSRHAVPNYYEQQRSLQYLSMHYGTDAACQMAVMSGGLVGGVDGGHRSGHHGSANNSCGGGATHRKRVVIRDPKTGLERVFGRQ